jgi:hypothetical protein
MPHYFIKTVDLFNDIRLAEADWNKIITYFESILRDYQFQQSPICDPRYMLAQLSMRPQILSDYQFQQSPSMIQYLPTLNTTMRPQLHSQSFADRFSGGGKWNQTNDKRHGFHPYWWRSGRY